MSGYLLSITGTVLLCALITAIAPEGKTSASVKGIAKLICVLTIISPIFQYLKTGDLEAFADKNRQDLFSQSVIEADGRFIQYYSEMRIRQAEEALREELLEKYGVEVEVDLLWRLEEEIRIEQICIKLPKNTDGEVKEDMQRYLMEKYSSEVLIE